MISPNDVVDVVVVSYNQRRRLLECCASVIDSEWPTRLIVVDNASEDGSARAVRAAFPDATVLELDDNSGFAVGVNRGVAVGSNDLVLLLNNDVRLRPDALRRLCEAIGDDGVAAVGPRLVDASGNVELSIGRTLSPLNELGFVLLGALYRDGRGPIAGWVRSYYGLPRDTRSLTAACLLVRRAALSAVGGMDERFFLYAEDVDLCRRLRRAGWGLRYVPDAEVVHVRGSSAATAPEAVARAYRESQLTFYRKHHGGPAAAALRAYLIVRFAVASIVGGAARRRRARAMLRWTLRQAG